MSQASQTPSREWITRFVADLPTAMALFDCDLQYVAASSAWLDLFGICGQSLIGLRHDEVGCDGGPDFDAALRRALAGGAAEPQEVEQDAATGWRRWAVSARPWRGADGTVAGVLCAVQELDLLPTEAALQHAPDALTGLTGRHGFTRRIAEILSERSPQRRSVAMFVVDLDNFKGVNDLHGARVGDHVLKIIANRLVSGTRSRPVPQRSTGRSGIPCDPDIVARLGADEFGIILGNPAPNLADAEAFARRLLQLAHNPIVSGQHSIRLTASVGFIVTSPAHRTEDDALRDLDIALQEAKTRGPNKSMAWEPALTSTVSRRLFLLDQLRRALDEGEFALHYQPILRLADGQLTGAEALLRWNHPSDGLVSPAAFLPVLEETGLIIPVGCWVIREVVRQMQVWQMLYGRDIVDWVSVNVSARQFNDPALLLSTLGEINDSGFPLDRLKVEITESAMMRNADTTRAVIIELQDLGIRVAIDDFGTGYSSLSTLRQYAVDTIKIDAGFISRLDTPDGKELVMALLTIARIYGAEIVAEGIETPLQRDLLRASNCGFGQGYLFARPMDGRSFGAYALTHLVEMAGDPEDGLDDVEPAAASAG